MRFFHNKITNPAGDAPSFYDWLAEFITKEASEAKPGLGLDDDNDPRGQGRGQVVNNDNEDGAHSYQEGESVDGKKEQGGNTRKDTGGTTDQKDHKQTDKQAATKKADVLPPFVCSKCGTKNTNTAKCTKCDTPASSNKEARKIQAGCGKEMGESKNVGKITEDHSDAKPGDDESKIKVRVNDDPNYQKGESTDPAKATGKSKKQPGEPVAKKNKKATSKNRFKRIASLNRAEKLKLFARLSADSNNPLPYVEAMVGIKFANMTEEEKQWFKDFWRTMYPPEYVEDMVADR